MILTREDVKELHLNGYLEVLLPKLPTKDVQKVQIMVGRPAVAEVRIVRYWPHHSGQTVVAVEPIKRLQTRSKPRTRRDTVRLMKYRRGTTADPRSAMRVVHERGEPDTTGVPHPDLTDAESEMVDEETENRFAQKAHQSAELRHLEALRRELIDRIDRTLEGCERLGVDPTRHLAAIERRVIDLEKQIRKASVRKAA